jgi:serine/threonine-protein kinase
MGTVYLGEHILLGRLAAIKTLLPALSVQHEIVERFFKEARATSAISDPGVVQVFDFGYHVDGTAYIVMELLEGEALSARIQRLGRLSTDEALRIARQVAGALAAAHERGVVHRDLKPENVFLVRDPEAQGGERAKILDFGVCKVGVDDVSLTLSGTTLGTPVYMSPEQCRGAGRVDHRSDIYALGCVLFHMLVGHPPFQAEGAGELIVAHLQQEPTLPSSFVPALSAPLDALVVRCLQKDAGDRFQSMAQFQDAIERVVAASSAPALEVIELVAPRAAVLGPGFESVFNAGLGTSRPRPTTLRAATGELPEIETWPPRRSGLRATLAIIAIAGVVTTVLAFQVLEGAERADAEPAAVPVVTPGAERDVTSIAHGPARAHVTVGPAFADPVPVASVPPALVTGDTSDDAREPRAVAERPVPRKAKKVKASKRSSKAAKKPKRSTPSKSPSPRGSSPEPRAEVAISPPGTPAAVTVAPAVAPMPTEDLYDTR